MPILEYKGEVICESMAIAKFLAELCNLAGTTTLNKAKADEIVLAVNGIFESVAKCIFAPEGERAGLKKKLIEETLPQKFGQLEGRWKTYSIYFQFFSPDFLPKSCLT